RQMRSLRRPVTTSEPGASVRTKWSDVGRHLPREQRRIRERAAVHAEHKERSGLAGKPGLIYDGHVGTVAAREDECSWRPWPIPRAPLFGRNPSDVGSDERGGRLRVACRSIEAAGATVTMDRW